MSSSHSEVTTCPIKVTNSLLSEGKFLSQHQKRKNEVLWEKWGFMTVRLCSEVSEKEDRKGY